MKKLLFWLFWLNLIIVLTMLRQLPDPVGILMSAVCALNLLGCFFLVVVAPHMKRAQAPLKIPLCRVVEERIGQPRRRP